MLNGSSSFSRHCGAVCSSRKRHPQSSIDRFAVSLHPHGWSRFIYIKYEAGIFLLTVGLLHDIHQGFPSVLLFELSLIAHFYSFANPFCLNSIAQRSFATAAPKSNMVGGKTMSQIWLSDKTTYPIMVIIAGACALSVYTMVVQTAKKADIRSVSRL